MSETPASTEPVSTGTPWSRYLKIGLPLLAVVVAVVVIGWPRWQVEIAINGLHATDGRARAQHIKELKENPDKELVIEELLDSVQDEGHSFAVRKMCCDLLVDHFNRLTRVNPMIAGGALHTRGVILSTLMHKDYFTQEYVEDPRYHVRDTVTEWLKAQGDVTRVYAIQLAVKIGMQDAMPLIRPLLRRSGLANVHDQEERDVMIAAGGAVERFGDCESVPVLAEVAEQDPDYLVRLRFMQQLERTVFRPAPEAACAGSLEQARMAALMRRGLADSDHRLRMGAMILFAQHPDWAGESVATLQALLDGDGSAAERRQALEALVAIHTPTFMEHFPAYFHDRSVEVRRTAARAVLDVGDEDLGGCWIGLLADEAPESGVPIERDARYALWRDVLDYLYKAAKDRKGFPRVLGLRAAKDRVAFEKDMATLFGTGELTIAATDGTFERLTRDGVAEAWFRWWCGRCGLDADRTEQAVAAWRACLAARRRGDAAAARTALEGLGFDAPGLFTYERAWLQVHQG